MRELPRGTVTFLFTDVEGSTRLLRGLGAVAYATALAEHRRVIREACAAEGGVEVDTQGDAFFFAFPTAPGAVEAAHAITQGLEPGQIRVRIGLHTGTPLLTDEGYIGDAVHRAARIAAAGHGGQVLISTSTAALIELELVDLGEHRFKDLAATERVFQLGDGDFGRLKTLYQTNLPIPATPFLGRERELREVVDLLSRDDVRLLTLTGTGGTGKTRLAVQAAAELGERYEHGIWWVPLASLVDAGLVLEQAGQALSAKGGLQAHIRDKRMLVLFDNFETVVAAGPDVAGLVAGCRNLDVLVTSREPLRVAAEQEYPVPPLAEAESVALFLARARAVRPDFEADKHVVEICSRLDNLPLAVELAAARARVLPPKQLLERLEQRLPLLTGGSRDTPERQRTLRATITWSYDLLSGHEQRLFARLSVFAGGCTLEAAEQVCDADLDTAQALVEKSLLRQAAGRYGMLETIREFALERLETTEGIHARRDGHAAYFARLADCRWPELILGGSDWRETLEAERRNLQIALEWSLAREHGEDALAIVSGIWFSWIDQRQGKHWAERALALPSPAVSQRRAHALAALGEAAEALGDLAEARRAFENALALYSELDEPRWVAALLAELADVALAEGDLRTARGLAEQSAAIRRERVGGLYLERPRVVLSEIALAEGDLDQAWEHLEAAAQHLHADGPYNFHMWSSVLERRGEVLRRRGEHGQAREAFGECVRLARRRGDPRLALEALDGVAAIWEAVGRNEDAVRLAGAVERFREESGHIARRFGQPVPVRVEPAWSEGRALTIDDAMGWVLDALD